MRSMYRSDWDHLLYSEFKPRPFGIKQIRALIRQARDAAIQAVGPDVPRDSRPSLLIEEAVEARQAYLEFLAAAWLQLTGIDPREACIVEHYDGYKADGSFQITWSIERKKTK